jgi:hypothetical protein
VTASDIIVKPLFRRSPDDCSRSYKNLFAAVEGMMSPFDFGILRHHTLQQLYAATAYYSRLLLRLNAGGTPARLPAPFIGLRNQKS